MYKAVKVKDAVETIDDLMTLSRVTNSESWNAYKLVLERNLRKVRNIYENHAQINDQVVEKDFRYQLGYVNALLYALDIPQEADILVKENS